MQILLIEPDKILASIYKNTLEQAGHSVSLSNHAQQAIHLADQQSPDLVVLELQLPGHSGIEFLYELRSYPEWQHIPVLIHSIVAPSSLNLQTTQLSSLGVKAYLYKPTTNLNELVQNIGHILQIA